MRGFYTPVFWLLVYSLLPPGWVAASGDSGDVDADADVTKQGKSNSDYDLPIDTGGLKTGCFYARDVNNWQGLNREYLIVYAPSKSRPYLVRISPPSIDLRSAYTIGFEGRDRICGKPGERLVMARAAARNFTILDVWRLDADTNARLVESKKARDSGAIDPAASPGAEVETDIKVDESANIHDSNPAEGDVASAPD